MKNQFEANFNLDDEQDVEKFLESYGCLSKRQIAHCLGFKGKGAFEAAQSLKNYAWNKITAISERKKGNIQDAIKYEDICDRIYRENIQGKIVCW